MCLLVETKIKSPNSKCFKKKSKRFLKLNKHWDILPELLAAWLYSYVPIVNWRLLLSKFVNSFCPQPLVVVLLNIVSAFARCYESSCYNVSWKLLNS